MKNSKLKNSDDKNIPNSDEGDDEATIKDDSTIITESSWNPYKGEIETSENKLSNEPVFMVTPASAPELPSEDENYHNSSTKKPKSKKMQSASSTETPASAPEQSIDDVTEKSTSSSSMHTPESAPEPSESSDVRIDPTDVGSFSSSESNQRRSEASESNTCIRETEADFDPTEADYEPSLMTSADSVDERFKSCMKTLKKVKNLDELIKLCHYFKEIDRPKIVKEALDKVNHFFVFSQLSPKK